MFRIVSIIVVSAVSGLFSQATFAGLVLQGLPKSEYFENFNGIGSALPIGWTIGGTTAQNPMGNQASYKTVKTAWGAGTAIFNAASNQSLTASAHTNVQDSESNRVVGIAQQTSGALLLPTYRLEIANVTGLTGFSLDFDFHVLKSGSRDFEWEVRWNTDSNFQNKTWTNFQVVHTFKSGTAFNQGRAFQNISLGTSFADAAKAGEKKYIQIVATKMLSGSGTASAPVIAIDNFRLRFSPVAVPEPTTLILVGLFLLTFVFERVRNTRISGSY